MAATRSAHGAPRPARRVSSGERRQIQETAHQVGLPAHTGFLHHALDLRAHGGQCRAAALGDLLVKHHLTEAFRNFVCLRETGVELGMARQLLARFDYAMLIVDEARGIWYRNEAAERLMKERDAVFERGGVLATRDDQAGTALTMAIRGLGLHDAVPAGQVSARSVISVPRSRHPPLLALVSALRPSESMGAFGMTARALVILHDPAAAHPSFDPQIISECFDLTPAEGRVAAQLAAGADAKDIASRTGVALPTVRTHIQRAMLKMGATRQADLVRALMGLPDRLDADTRPSGVSRR
ncbi:helix-turn-helix transcriptional regulator [Variovorax sp. LT1R16]|uniref:helix-turn-helix transcriptional regulator n=1 Tax=Variovorax sp. LT1R16 TaxID=3443728 RepID=UPI003F47E6D7